MAFKSRLPSGPSGHTDSTVPTQPSDIESLANADTDAETAAVIWLKPETQNTSVTFKFSIVCKNEMIGAAQWADFQCRKRPAT